MYILSGFATYVACLYFMMVSRLCIDWLLLPQLLNGYGMCSLFIAIWPYGLSGILQTEMLTSAGSVMVFFSFMATAFFCAVFSGVQYVLQCQSVNNLATHFDAMTISAYVVSGFGEVQLRAIFAANKVLLGYVIAGLALLTFIFFHQFGDFKYRIVRYRMRKSDSQKRKDRKPAIDASSVPESVAGILWLPVL